MAKITRPKAAVWQIYFRSINIWFIVFTISFSINFTTSAQADPSLRGLKRLYISPLIVNPAFELAGLSKQFIISRVEERLRGTGIDIIKEEEFRSTLGRPLLLVHLSGEKDRQSFIFTLAVEMCQDVYLKRDKAIEDSLAVTWSDRYLGRDTPEGIVRVLDSMMSKFIEKYRSVNP
jgi:hypothetical protein